MKPEASTQSTPESPSRAANFENPSNSSNPPNPVPHVNFLGALFIVGGALTGVVGLSLLALAVGAASVLGSSGRSTPFAGTVAVVVYLVLGVLALVWGIAHVAVGLPLRRRRHWSRLVALMLGSVDLVILPYGTALGAYALWTLLGDAGKHAFDESPATPEA